MRKLVSIIVPIYNAEDYLLECLSSIQNQTYSNLEILLSNDGSTDSSLNICKHFVENDARFTLLSHDNIGVSSTRNLSLEHCKGEYIAFIDADDVVDNDFIETLVDNLEETRSDCSVVNILSGRKKEFLKSGIIESEERPYCVIKYLFHKYQGYLCNKIYKKKIIDEYSIRMPSNLTIMEDMIFNLCYFMHCEKIVYCTARKYFYRQHGRSAINNLENERWFDILKAYQIIISMLSKNSAFSDITIYGYSMALMEAKYRSKFVKMKNKGKLDEFIESELDDLMNSWSKLSLTKRMKLRLFSICPSMVMKYKRRMLRI